MGEMVATLRPSPDDLSSELSLVSSTPFPISVDCGWLNLKSFSIRLSSEALSGNFKLSAIFVNDHMLPVSSHTSCGNACASKNSSRFELPILSKLFVLELSCFSQVAA